MTPAEIEIARKNLEIANQALAAANQQAIAANAQVELAKWQLAITVVLALIPVAVAIWQILRTDRLRFSTGYHFRSGPEEDCNITIHNNNNRAVHIGFWEVYWSVPSGVLRWREEKVEDAWRDDYIASFDIPPFGRNEIALGYEDNFRWPHKNPRARLRVRISVGGGGRPVSLTVKDQALDGN